MNVLEMVLFCIAGGALLIGMIGIGAHYNDEKSPKPLKTYIIIALIGMLIVLFTGASLSGRQMKLSQRDVCITTLQALGDNKNDSLYILTLPSCVYVKDSIIVKMITEPEAR